MVSDDREHTHETTNIIPLTNTFLSEPPWQVLATAQPFLDGLTPMTVGDDQAGLREEVRWKFIRSFTLRNFFHLAVLVVLAVLVDPSWVPQAEPGL